MLLDEAFVYRGNPWCHQCTHIASSKIQIEYKLEHCNQQCKKTKSFSILIVAGPTILTVYIVFMLNHENTLDAIMH
jgi:hypothetical protein